MYRSLGEKSREGIPCGRPRIIERDGIRVLMQCEDRRWLRLAQDRIQWWILVLAVSKLRLMPPGNCIITCRKGRQHRDFVSFLLVTLRSETLPEHHAMWSEYMQVPIEASESRNADNTT